MPLFMLSYDLVSKKPADYERVEKTLDALNGKHILESTWILDIGQPPGKLLENFMKNALFATDDRVSLAEIIHLRSKNTLTTIDDF
jgi:hypothetical protein